MARFVLDTNVISELDVFARPLQLVYDDRAMWADAAELWADQRRRGRTSDDADLLIAAFTRRLRATLVTNTTSDFVDLNLLVVDWTIEQGRG